MLNDLIRGLSWHVFPSFSDLSDSRQAHSAFFLENIIQANPATGNY